MDALIPFLLNGNLKDPEAFIHLSSVTGFHASLNCCQKTRHMTLYTLLWELNKGEGIEIGSGSVTKKDLWDLPSTDPHPLSSTCLLFVGKNQPPRPSCEAGSACEAGDQGSISGLGSSSGEGNGNPLQQSYLENSMDREAWRATVCEVTKSQTQLSD